MVTKWGIYSSMLLSANRGMKMILGWACLSESRVSLKQDSSAYERAWMEAHLKATWGLLNRDHKLAWVRWF